MQTAVQNSFFARLCVKELIFISVSSSFVMRGLAAAIFTLPRINFICYFVRTIFSTHFFHGQSKHQNRDCEENAKCECCCVRVFGPQESKSRMRNTIDAEADLNRENQVLSQAQ